MTTPVSFPLAKLLKEKGFDEPCCSRYWVGYEKEEHLQIECLSNNYNDYDDDSTIYYSAPTFSQAINFLYICSNKQIDIELKASDTYEERVRKVAQGCEDLRNLQNSKSN